MQKSKLHKNAKDLTGNRYGNLIVLNISDIQNVYGRVVYDCLCDCGKSKITYSDLLVSGKTKSCGCLKAKTRRNVDRVYEIQKGLYNGIKTRSKKLELSYDIELEDFIHIINQPCFYCGVVSSNFATDRKNRKGEGRLTDTVYEYNGIDRVDSSIGYNKNNVVSCCKFCNFAKHTMSLTDFMNWIKRVYEYNF